jgi:hypothetical protein
MATGVRACGCPGPSPDRDCPDKLGDGFATEPQTGEICLRGMDMDCWHACVLLGYWLEHVMIPVAFAYAGMGIASFFV